MVENRCFQEGSAVKHKGKRLYRQRQRKRIKIGITLPKLEDILD
jgi:hypothetical protein